MSVDRLKQILSNTPKDIQVDFTGFCEAFLNPLASEMMRYSVEQGFRTVLLTTLTGFTKHDADILKGVEFSDVLVHEYEGTPIDYPDFNRKEQWIRDAVKTNHYERFKLRKEDRWSRAGNLYDVEPKSGPFECGWTGREFYRNVVLPNGDVYLCCMDYGLKHKLGNMIETHYNDLDRDKIVRATTEENSDVICRKCEIFKRL